MNKLVCLTKPIEELKEGKNLLEVGHICPGSAKPSPYPGTISMSCDFDIMKPIECSENNTPKYTVNVDVSFDENGNPSFRLISKKLISKTKTTLEADDRYISEAKKNKRDAYKANVDDLTMEYQRKQILGYDQDELDAIKVKIQEESNKIN